MVNQHANLTLCALLAHCALRVPSLCIDQRWARPLIKIDAVSVKKLCCCPYRSGMFGSGLVTLSRHPIVRHQFWRYAAGGFATAISCGDYYAGKGGQLQSDTSHVHGAYHAVLCCASVSSREHRWTWPSAPCQKHHEPLAPLWVARLCRAKSCNCSCNCLGTFDQLLTHAVPCFAVAWCVQVWAGCAL